MSGFPRNDLCFCGSGTKYKRCCNPKTLATFERDKDRAASMLPVQPTRIVLDDGTSRRVLFKITASGFGGFIVTFGGSDTLTDWRYGPVEHPAGETSTGVMVEGQRIEVDDAPKLHYHPSGHVSLNQDQREDTHPRRSLQALPMEDVEGQHVMTLMLTRPDLFPIVGGDRNSDILLSVNGPLSTMKVVGTIHPIVSLDAIVHRAPTNPTAIPPGNNTTGLPLVFTRLDSYGVPVYVGLEFHANPDHFRPERAEHPQMLAIAFDPRTMGDANSEATTLGVWNAPPDPDAAAAVEP